MKVLNDEAMGLVIDLRADGKSLEEIKKTLKEELDIDITIGGLSKAIKAHTDKMHQITDKVEQRKELTPREWEYLQTSLQAIRTSDIVNAGIKDLIKTIQELNDDGDTAQKRMYYDTLQRYLKLRSDISGESAGSDASVAMAKMMKNLEKRMKEA